MRTFFIIVDEHTDKQRAVAIWDKIRSYLNEQKINYRFSKIRPEFAASTAEKIVRTCPAQQLNECIIMAVGRHSLMLDTIRGIKNAGKKEIPVAFITTEENDTFMEKIGVSSSPIAALKQILNAVRPTYFNLGQVDETTHDSRRLFTDKLDIGFDAYTANSLINARSHNFFSRFHLTFLLKIWNTFTSYINQESFEVTMRVNQKYNFYKHTFSVKIENTPHIANAQQQRSDNELEIELVNNMNFFFYLLFSIARHFGLQYKLPFVHRFTSSQVHLVIKSLEFGQIDGAQMNNRFYDVFFKSFSYPFWYDIDSIPLSDLPKNSKRKKSSAKK